jgi:UPF0271 protein
MESLKSVDLNVDIGEGFPHDEALLSFASSASVCCGEHAGSRDLTERTVDLCRRKRVRIGAHPGYPDRASMGRRPLAPGEERPYLDSLFDQVRWFVREFEPAYLKPHGAFYNDTSVPLPEGWDVPSDGLTQYGSGGKFLAQTAGIQSLAMMLRVFRLDLMGLPGGAHAEAASRAGRNLIAEGFADRRLLPNGQLMPRSEPNAVTTDEDQVVINAIALAPVVQTICLHGDTPNCLRLAERVHKGLRDAGFRISA